MPYLGKTPSQATRQRYYLTASGGETSISGTMTTGGTLTFTDGEFVDVSVNGVALVAGTDYNTTTANTIGGLSALTANDQVEIVVYDTFSVFSGDVDSNLSVGGNLSVTGTSTFTGAVTADAGVTVGTATIDSNGDIKLADSDVLYLGSGLDLQIQHNGSNSFISDAGTGDMYIRGDNNLFIQNLAGTENKAQFVTDGAVNLMHNGSTKFSTQSNGARITHNGASANSVFEINNEDTSGDGGEGSQVSFNEGGSMKSAITSNFQSNSLIVFHEGSNRVIIESDGTVLVAKSSGSATGTGVILEPNGQSFFGADTEPPIVVNRNNNDGNLVLFMQADSVEGTISVSGTTVSYNGGHLSRWSQATDGNRIDGLVKGTVMTNLDQMALWHHEAQAATYYTADDELPDGVSVGDEKTPAVAAYDEDNEQLNCMAVSSVEGDANVAGVFVNWDDDDEDFTADMNIAMTGDMVIRIAQGTTVARGDLLMSAGDGTAKPQGDDIVRSKTIAKVTSITKSHTYDDGSYLVPCVLMAC